MRDDGWVYQTDEALVLPALKRVIGVEIFHGALKRSFPRINARAPTGFAKIKGMIPIPRE